MERSEVWNKVDEYFGNKLLPSDSTLEQVLLKNKEADIPEIDVSPAQGKFLYLLTKIKAIKNVLEIGNSVVIAVSGSHARFLSMVKCTPLKLTLTLRK